MRNEDERVNVDICKAKSLGYTIFWYGVFALLLFRWFVMGQTLVETIDVFSVWLLASITQFLAMAAKGVPVSYPVAMTKREQLYFVFVVPLVSGLAVVGLLFFLRQVVDPRHLLGGFAGGFFGTLVIFLLYKTILFYWEKRYTE